MPQRVIRLEWPVNVFRLHIRCSANNTAEAAGVCLGQTLTPTRGTECQVLL